jgi:hypothetical protein
MLQNMFGMLPFYVPWVLPNLQHKTYTAKAAIQGYLRETSDENFVICNPKYKKPLELDILFNSKKVSKPSSLANKINHDTFS